jgi:hypothetical protein
MAARDDEILKLTREMRAELQAWLDSGPTCFDPVHLSREAQRETSLALQFLLGEMDDYQGDLCAFLSQCP